MTPLPKPNRRIFRSYVLVLSLLGAACETGPQISSTQAVSPTADLPYGNILVVALFESFDARRYLEKEIVAKLEERGVAATAMTSMTDTRTIINRDTVLDRVERTGADAVLVTQLVAFESRGKEKDARPQATYNVWPTYYYNVFAVQLTEYVEPEYIEFTNSIALSSDMYSVQSQERIWAVNSDWEFKEGLEPGRDYSKIVEEAEAIVRAADRDGLLGN